MIQAPDPNLTPPAVSCPSGVGQGSETLVEGISV